MYNYMSKLIKENGQGNFTRWKSANKKITKKNHTPKQLEKQLLVEQIPLQGMFSSTMVEGIPFLSHLEYIILDVTNLDAGKLSTRGPSFGVSGLREEGLEALGGGHQDDFMCIERLAFHDESHIGHVGIVHKVWICQWAIKSTALV